MKKNWRKQIELFVLGITALISVLVSVLDFLGLLSQITWLNLSIPSLTLFLLGSLALFIAIERRNFHEANQEELISRLNHISVAQEIGIHTIIGSLNGVYVRSFDDAVDCIKYINKRLLEASKSIDDTSWSSATNTRSSLPKTISADQEFRERTTKAQQNLLYREILIFNRPQRWEKLKRRITEDAPGYFCAYFENDPSFPLLQYMIIDKKEVIIVADQYPVNLSIRHSKIVEIFQLYFDDCWNKATIIKDANGIRPNVVEKILSEKYI